MKTALHMRCRPMVISLVIYAVLFLAVVSARLIFP